MSSSGSAEKVALPYAAALLESSEASDLRDQTSQDLKFVSDMFVASPDLKVFIENPLVVSTAKKNVLNELLSKEVSEVFLTFLFVLVDRNRIALLNIITERYLELAYKLESTTIANVKTAIGLTDVQHESLVKKIQEITNAKSVKLIVNVDPDLIGGFSIQIGSKVIDTSLQGKLNQIASYLNVT